METITETVEVVTAPPPPEGKKSKVTITEKREDDATSRPVKQSHVMRELGLNEDRSIKEFLESLGNEGVFRIRLHRLEPEFATVGAKRINIAGFLRDIDEAIDEEWIQTRYGGGKFTLNVKRRNEKGSFVHAGSRTVKIAGEPNLDELPRNKEDAAGPAAAVAVAGAEQPSIVREAMTIMARQVEKADERADRAGGRGGASDDLVQILRDDLRSRDAQLAELRSEIREANRTPVPVPSAVDQTQAKLLDKLIDGDSARITALRAQYESQLGALRDQMWALEQRLRDGFERDRTADRQSHEREISMLRSSHESTLSAIRSSSDVALSTAKGSGDMQRMLLEAEVKRLRDELTDARDDLKEIRSKKDKTAIEQLTELKELKELLTDDDEEEKEKSGWEKAIETVANPETINAVGQFFRQPAAAAVVQAPVPQRRRGGRVKRAVVLNKETGQKFMREEDGSLVPISPPVGVDGVSPELPPAPLALPTLDAGQVAQTIKFLEGAFDGGQDPETVARMAQSVAPPELIQAIRDHGVDRVMLEVAKLPGTSSLSSQAGRNWIRKLGKVLAGD